MITTFDDARRDRVEWDPAAAAWWTDLGRAAGTVDVGLRLMEVDAGKLSVPLHVHSREEEIVYVLEGAGYSWQGETKHPIASGDCVVYRNDDFSHSLEAGENGLTALVFGTRERSDISYLPRTRKGHVGRFWFDMTLDDPPREETTHEPRLDETRPPNILHVDAATADYEGEAGRWVLLARQAGAARTGLNYGRLEAGRMGAPPHCHSADEELFVVIAGGGTLELWPSPVQAETHTHEQHELSAGHVVSRPPSTGISHCFRAGAEGMTFLAYGTRRPNDVCYYPRSNKIYWRGLGLIARLEPLAYDDGEPQD
jgi:uncharacterized cupin superfamily protein